VAEYDGEPIVIGFRIHDGIEGLNEIHRLEVTWSAHSSVANPSGGEEARCHLT